MKNRTYLLKSNDWEGLYIDNKLIQEGHSLNEGRDRILYFAKLAKQYDFELIDLIIEDLDNVDNEWTRDIGGFPETMDGFIRRYEVD